MKSLSKRKVPLLLPLLLFAALTLLPLFGCGAKSGTSEEAEQQPDRSLVLGYADEGVTEVEDPDALAKAWQEAVENAQNSAIALEFKNDAVSTDGINFDCYIANSVNNMYDMFIQIFADDAYQDEIFLSQLLRPGLAFEHIKLNHELPKGTTRCYVAMTQVETVDGEQTAHAQTFYTVDFHVL